MKLLDLYCGAGGAAMGYHRAGFDEIVGIDIKPQPRYPFTFIQADALEYPLDGFDWIHASPPCQRFSVAALNNKTKYADLLTPTRKRFYENGGMWVIENVPNAPMQWTIKLCGLMFNLKVFRHRLFELSHLIFQPTHPPHKGKRIGEGYFSVCGNSGGWTAWGNRKIKKGSISECRDAMGIDWMIRKEITQAVPPAYTEFIGKQLIEAWWEGRKGK